MSRSNGAREKRQAPLELSDVLYIQTNAGSALAFEVVGILEDPDDGAKYAVLRHESTGRDEDDFIVTDLDGKLLEENRLAQEILDEFLAVCESDDHSASDGETS